MSLINELRILLDTAQFNTSGSIHYGRMLSHVIKILITVEF